MCVSLLHALEDLDQDVALTPFGVTQDRYTSWQLCRGTIPVAERIRAACNTLDTWLTTQDLGLLITLVHQNILPLWQKHVGSSQIQEHWMNWVEEKIMMMMMIRCCCCCCCCCCIHLSNVMQPHTLQTAKEVMVGQYR